MQNELSINEAMHLVRERIKDRTRYAYLLTFGCQQNESDSEKLAGMCEEMGYVITTDPELADLAIVNTCAVREHAEKRALSLIGAFKRRKEKKRDMIIAVAGCMAARPERREQFRKSYPYVSFTMRPSDVARLPLLLLRSMTEGKRFFSESDLTVEIAEGLPVKRAYRHRAYVTVMYGCNNFCSYCIVPHVRGRERSRASEAIVEEVRSLVKEGCRDIMLLGQNVNSYHSDCDFAELLTRIDQIEGDYVVRFMSSHPKDVPPSLIRALGSCRHVEAHFHLPVQAGSDRILAEMNRHYTAEEYLSILDEVRRVKPDIAITSDIMIGFPGETEEDFASTLSLLRRARFDMVFSFLYSPREGTPAAEREDQVEDAVKSERMSRLIALQDEISLEKNLAYVGRCVRVLVDTVPDDGASATGRTSEGKLVHFPSNGASVGDFVNVRIERAEPYALIGKAV